MNQFFYDMIHMTEGEKLINYWWLWVIIVICFAFISLMIDGRLK